MNQAHHIALDDVAGLITKHTERHMKQARLKLLNRINAIDAILDNTLLPVLAVLALIAFICEVTT